MSNEQKEFHFGIHVTQIVDVKIMADNAEQAQELFMAASNAEGGLRQYPQTIIEREFEVLGMIEGPLPAPPPGTVPEHAVTGDVVH